MTAKATGWEAIVQTVIEDLPASAAEYCGDIDAITSQLPVTVNESLKAAIEPSLEWSISEAVIRAMHDCARQEMAADHEDAGFVDEGEAAFGRPD